MVRAHQRWAKSTEAEVLNKGNRIEHTCFLKAYSSIIIISMIREEERKGNSHFIIISGVVRKTHRFFSERVSSMGGF